jgi:hypothetical protein
MAPPGEKVNKPVRKKCEPGDDHLGVRPEPGQAGVGIPETVRFHIHAIHERTIEAAPLFSQYAADDPVTALHRTGAEGGDREFDIGPAIYPVVFAMARQ